MNGLNVINQRRNFRTGLRFFLCGDFVRLENGTGDGYTCGTRLCWFIVTWAVRVGWSGTFLRALTHLLRVDETWNMKIKIINKNKREERKWEFIILHLLHKRNIVCCAMIWHKFTSGSKMFLLFAFLRNIFFCCSRLIIIFVGYIDVRTLVDWLCV